MRRVYGLWWCSLFCAVQGQSQVGPMAFAPMLEVPEAVSFFGPFFVPKLIADGCAIKDYVRSEEYARVRVQFGDTRAVDALFDKAMRLSWNNVYEALLISLFSTMDHRRFGVRLPVVGPLLWVPLSSEFPEEFEQRVRALPSRLYEDTPEDHAGDRDKLQHFFGSAFLTYCFESKDVAARVGDFIETYEERIIVGGVLDARDFRANVQGQEFGMRLLDDRSLLPSTFLRMPVDLGAQTGVGCTTDSFPGSLTRTLEDR